MHDKTSASKKAAPDLINICNLQFSALYKQGKFISVAKTLLLLGKIRPWQTLTGMGQFFGLYFNRL